MARVPILEKDQIKGDLKETFAKMSSRGTPVLNIFKVMAHCPEVGRDFLKLGNSLLLKGRVDPCLRELAILRVGHLAGAVYEWTQHAVLARRVGVPQEQIDALPDWQSSEKFDEKEKAVLQYVDEVAENIRVSQEKFQKIKHYFTDEQVVELTVVIGYYGAVCRVLEALEIELEY